MAQPTSSNKLQCVVVTPERTVLEQAVDFVAVPLYDGELGVLPGRAPLVARLGRGELRTQVGAASSSYFVDGGFLQIRDNVVSVLTPRAVPAERIDRSAAERDLTAANAQTPTTPDGFESKTLSLARARAQLRIAQRTKK